MRTAIWVSVCAVLLVGLLVGGILWVSVDEAHSQLAAQRRNFVAKAQPVLPAFLEAVKGAPALKLLESDPSGEDAGPFLNPRLPWEKAAGLTGPSSPALAVPPKIAAQLKQWAGEWPSQKLPDEWSTLDFGWMRELSRYGKWSLLAGSPLTAVAEPRPMTMPIPDFITLQTWVKLRLMKAKRDGDWVQASKELHHLAALATSTEVLIGPMIGIAFLGIERRALEQAAREGLDVGGVTAISEDETTRMRAAVWGAYVFTFPSMPESVQTQALAHGGFVCAALAEQVDRVWRRSLMEDVPKGPVDAAFAHPPAPCRLDTARWLLEHRKTTDRDELRAELAKTDQATWITTHFGSLTVDALETAMIPWGQLKDFNELTARKASAHE